MNFVPEGFARAFYDELLSTHHDGGARRKEEKIQKYRDIMLKFWPYIKGKIQKIDPAAKQTVTVEAIGWPYINAQKRSDRNPNGTIPAVVAARAEMLNAMRNDIQHHQDEFGWDDYYLAVRILAGTVEFFSGVPVPPEVKAVYVGAAPPGSGPAWQVPGAGAGETEPVMEEPGPDAPIPEGLKWLKTPGGIVITKYEGSAENLVIPGVIDGFPVVSIGPKAFYGSAQLHKVNFPAGLKTIGNSAFYQCNNLATVSFPEGLEMIEAYAFHRCYKLGPVSLPKSLKKIDKDAFSFCSMLNVAYLSRKTELGIVCFNRTIVEYYD